jgi:tetratricopeptide (TPR) repeat protein
MKNRFFTRLFLLLLFPAMGFGQAAYNAELKKMYEEDQGARMVPKIDWTVVGKADSARERRVYQLIDSGKIITAKDYYFSAMIFQHGRDSVAYGMAVAHMRKAIELDTSISRWLLAAAIDRELMSKNKPQVYGTQYIQRGPNAKWERYTIDTTRITDAERIYYYVETLAEQREKERNMNLQQLAVLYAKTKSVPRVIELIKKEKAAGVRSVYNVTESAVNIFGYELVAVGRDKDALQVFLLNTELYPKGFNTFDSLGECLMRLGRKREGLAAYKKSLALNPGNSDARAVLEANR